MDRRDEVIQYPVEFQSRKYASLRVNIASGPVVFKDFKYFASEYEVLKQLISLESYGNGYTTPGKYYYLIEDGTIIDLFGKEESERFKILYPPELVKDVSIIIGTWENPRCIRECLDSIYSYTPRGYELIVVDNATDQVSKGIIAEYQKLLGENMKLIVNPENNKSFAQFNNEAAKIATRKYVVCLNDDTVVRKYWLESMVRVMQSEQNIGLVGKRTFHPNYSPFHHCESNTSGEIEEVYGHCMLLRREDAWFDERYIKAGWEDIDLNRRIHHEGKRIFVERRFPIIHKGSQSVSRVEGYGTIISTRNKSALEDKWSKIH